MLLNKEPGTERRTCIRQRPKVLRGRDGSTPCSLHDRPIHRARPRKPGSAAHHPIQTNGPGLDHVSTSKVNHKRDDAAVRKVSSPEMIARVVENRVQLELRDPQIRKEGLLVGLRQRRQEPVRGMRCLRQCGMHRRHIHLLCPRGELLVFGTAQTTRGEPFNILHSYVWKKFQGVSVMSGPTGGSAVSRALARECVFDPETTQAMRVAFDAARWVLGQRSGSDESAAGLAKLIVELAGSGEDDPWRLRAAAFRRLQHEAKL